MAELRLGSLLPFHSAMGRSSNSRTPSGSVSPHSRRSRLCGEVEVDLVPTVSAAICWALPQILEQIQKAKASTWSLHLGNQHLPQGPFIKWCVIDSLWEPKFLKSTLRPGPLHPRCVSGFLFFPLLLNTLGPAGKMLPFTSSDPWGSLGIHSVFAELCIK